MLTQAMTSPAVIYITIQSLQYIGLCARFFILFFFQNFSQDKYPHAYTDVIRIAMYTAGLNLVLL